MTAHRARNLAAATFMAVFGIAAGLINLSWWALGLGALAGGYVLAVAVEDQPVVIHHPGPRHRGDRVKRALAKTTYKLGGWLSKVKTPTRTYALVSIDPFVTEPAGRRWSACGPSMWLLKKSMRLDWEHWDHWALVHDKCNPVPCLDCGGCSCDDQHPDAEDEP